MPKPAKGTTDKHKLRPHRRLYIALEDLDFSWLYEEARMVIDMWKKGYPAGAIMLTLERDADEVAILIMDLARNNWRLPKTKTYTALDGLDFSWYYSEVYKVKEMWAKGWPLDSIAHNMKRKVEEVALLIMDLARQSKIKPRKNGAFGG